jgi:peptidoglycan/LPS O-acetylase OafA/YrhL
MTTIGSRLTETNNRPSGFDYMRLVLALGVVWSHSNLLTGDWPEQPLLKLTFGAVDAFLCPMFFALSGFLVAGSLERSNTLITFLGLRCFRIVPALAVEVVLCALVLGPLFTSVPLQRYFTSPQFGLYFLNVLGDIHYDLLGVFATNPNTMVNGQLWTVPWEIVCYIVLSALAAVGIVRRRGLLVLVLVGLYLAQVGLDIVRTDRNPWTVGGSSLVISFVAGLVLYRFREEVVWSKRLCFIMAVLSLLLFGVPHGLRFAALPSAYVTVYLGLLSPSRSKIILSGDYSYGVYLYGYPVQQAVVTSLGHDFHRWYWNLLFAVPCAMVVAAGSWWLIEKPALLQRKRLQQVEQWYLEKFSFFFTGIGEPRWSRCRFHFK